MPMDWVFRIVLEDGAAAEPPSFTSGYTRWQIGDTLFEDNPRCTIVDIVSEEDDPEVVSTFVVAPL